MAGIQAIQKGERIVQLIVEGRVYDVGMTDEQYNALIDVLKSERPYDYDEANNRYIEAPIGTAEREEDNFTHYSSYRDDTSISAEERAIRIASRQVQELLRNANEKERIEFVRTLINAIKAAYFKLNFSETTLSMTVPDFSVQDDKSKGLNIRVLSNGVSTITANLANKAMQEALVTLERVSNVITAVNLPNSIGTYPYQLVEGIANSIKYFINGDYIKQFIPSTSDIYTSVVAPYERIWNDSNALYQSSNGWIDAKPYGNGYTFLPATYTGNTISNAHVYARKYCGQVTIECTGSNATDKAIDYDEYDGTHSAIGAKGGDLLLFTIKDSAFLPAYPVQTVCSVGTVGNYGYIRITGDGEVRLLHSVSISQNKVNYIGSHALICFNISYKSNS